MVDENLTSFATYVRNMAMKCFSAITDMIRTTKVPARMTTTMVQLQPIQSLQKVLLTQHGTYLDTGATHHVTHTPENVDSSGTTNSGINSLLVGDGAA